MPGYDITSILDFRPPTLLCKRCRALIYGLKLDVHNKIAHCPECKGEYSPDYIGGDLCKPTYPYYKANEYLLAEGCGIKFDNLVEHSRSLARLVLESKGNKFSSPWPTMRLFLSVLAEAKAFVHFASYGISHQMLGALKLTSMRVPVCGWASNVDGNTRAEIEEWPSETPGFMAKAINSQHWLQDVPHQKLVIIDGLLAFTGSANLTNRGMRQVDRAFDIQNVVTDLTEVRRLNNTYFSKVWADIGGLSSPVVVMETEPF